MAPSSSVLLLCAGAGALIVPQGPAALRFAAQPQLARVARVAPQIRSAAAAAKPTTAPRELTQDAVGLDQWVQDLDYPAFRKEVKELGDELGTGVLRSRR